MPVTRHLRESLLPKISLLRPVTVTMIFVALMVVGIVTYLRMPVAMLPSGQENPGINIWIPYANASPREVERQIARPVEGMLRTMGGVDRIYTTSNRGGCWSDVRFNQNVDMAEAYNQLRERVDRLLLELPDDVENVFLRKWSVDDLFIVGVDFLLDRDYDDLYALMDEQLRKPLERIDGVANVEIWGAQALRIEIGLVQERLNTHRVDVYSLMEQLRNDNFALSSGWVRDSARKLYIRSDSRFESLNEIRNLPVEGHPGLVIEDIADISYAAPEDEHFFRLDGKPGAGLLVRKEGGANTVDVCKRVVDALHNDLLKKPQLRGFQPRFYLDQGQIILGSLKQLTSAGLWGGLFAVLVLFYFMRRIRMTFIITAAIPLSILISLTLVYFLGWSLNIITMMGLIIGLGMVVDNSIVVTEAIYARRVAGQDPRTAARQGASEVALAITVSTATTCAVFLPLIFMTGDKGLSFAMARIGLPVIFALVGSLVVALLFIPLVASRIMSSSPGVEPKSISWVTRLYGRLLDTFMRHRLETTVVSLMIFMSVTVPMGKVPMAFRGEGSIFNSLYVRYMMPTHYNIAQTDSILAQYETFLDENREQYGIVYVQTDIWRAGGSTWAFLETDTREWYHVAWDKILTSIGMDVSVPVNSDEAVKHFRENAPRFAGVKINLDRRQSQQGRTSVTLFGDDTSTLLRLSEEVERRLRYSPMISAVSSEIERGVDELQLRIDRERASQYDLDGTTVAATLNYAMRGAPLSRYHTPEREVDLVMALRKNDRRTLDQVMNLYVAGEDGRRTALGSIVDVNVDRGLDEIRRENGKTKITITAFSTERDLVKLGASIHQVLDGLAFPPGYQWNLSGRFESIDEQNVDIAFAMAMAGLFVFLLMGILFESFILPLSVIMSIPFSFVGVFWALYITGEPFDMMAGIGAVILIGVVVNNAIVLVDLVNRLIAEGYDRHEAIVEAGRQRFRPILMTSGTTIFGLLPMAIGNTSAMGISYNTLGQAMIGGLMVSTLLTLFVVPLFFTLFDDLRVVAVRMFSLVGMKPDNVNA
jgi:hydrophobic/amphiphilic exporter-1 (mainly G- bacteria), HAE1 family